MCVCVCVRRNQSLIFVSMRELFGVVKICHLFLDGFSFYVLFFFLLFFIVASAFGFPPFQFLIHTHILLEFFLFSNALFSIK